MNASDYSKLAHEIISEYNSADDPGLLRQKIAEAFADVVTKAIADERDAKWQPIETAPRDGSPLRLFAKSLIDPDFNASGSVEGYWQDDDGWVGAVWDSCHDLWERKRISPTHWQLLPAPPAAGKWEIARLCGRDSQDSIDAAFAELRELFPDTWMTLSVQDRIVCLRYFAQIGLNGQDFEGRTLSEVVAKVTQWHQSPAIRRDDTADTQTEGEKE